MIYPKKTIMLPGLPRFRRSRAGRLNLLFMWFKREGGRKSDSPRWHTTHRIEVNKVLRRPRKRPHRYWHLSDDERWYPRCAEWTPLSDRI
jgi:hypothetical protein